MLGDFQKIVLSRKSLAYMFCFGTSVLAVIAGGLIYVLLRPAEAGFIHWFRFTQLEDWIESLRSNTVIFSQLFPEWIVYSLPNGLWAFAYSLLIFTIWGRSKSKIKYIWYLSIPLLVLGFEILQYPGIIRGTFSFQDILTGVIGIVAGIFFGKLIIKSNRYEKN